MKFLCIPSLLTILILLGLIISSTAIYITLLSKEWIVTVSPFKALLKLKEWVYIKSFLFILLKLRYSFSFIWIINLKIFFLALHYPFLYMILLYFYHTQEKFQFLNYILFHFLIFHRNWLILFCVLFFLLFLNIILLKYITIHNLL